MTRTLADLEAALHAEADLEVDTDVMKTIVERGAAARRRRRSVAAGAGLAVTMAVVAVSLEVVKGGRDVGGADSVPFAQQCSITALPLPAGLSGLDENIVGNLMVNGMDSTGRFIVASYNHIPNDVVLIVRWDNGVPTLLPMNDPGLVAHGINAQGAVVGGHRTEQSYAWLYSDGGFTMLPTPVGARYAEAFAINDRGDIAGEAVVSNGTRVAVVWRANEQYAARVLSAPGSAGARGINADGIVVGFAASGGDEEFGRPYGWHPLGEGAFLPSPRDYNFAHATQIRGAWAVGFGWRSVTDVSGTTQERVAVRWNLASDGVTTVERWAGLPFIGVSADGTVVTETSDGATMITGGQPYQLPRLPHDRSALLNPAAMSADGTVIVGRQVGVARQPVVLWRC